MSSETAVRKQPLRPRGANGQGSTRFERRNQPPQSGAQAIPHPWAYTNGESHTELEDEILDRIDKERGARKLFAVSSPAPIMRGGPYFVQVPGETRQRVDASNMREARLLVATEMGRERLPKGTRVWLA